MEEVGLFVPPTDTERQTYCVLGIGQGAGNTMIRNPVPVSREAGVSWGRGAEGVNQ